MKCWIALLLCLPATAGFGAPSANCEVLKTLQLRDTRITLAQSVTPNPQWKYPPSIFTAMPAPTDGVRVPFCRVTAVIEKEIHIEIWLPRQWNGRFQGVGNAGYSGAINYPALGAAVTRGFAAASTDTGHRTERGFFETSWIEGHSQRVIDFAHRAHHLMAQRAKEITAAYYAKPAQFSYFNGCSSGGWQGLTEAQRYPDDYDGIVAGAPAINFVRLQSRAIWMAQLAEKDPEGRFTAQAAKLLANSAIAVCDGLDGLQDGQITDPSRCAFDPATLLCDERRGEEGGCLTPAQVRRAKAIYGPLTSAGGLKLYAGHAPGTIPGTDLLGPDGGSVPGEVAMVLMLANKPRWNVSTFDPDRHLLALDRELGPTLNAMETDLRPFRRRGGKLILYHGWADPVLSPYNTIDYYHSLVKALGAEEVEGFARLFMAPGMAHCAGGSGPSSFDAVDAVMKWVEHGTAPDRLIASRITDGEIDRTRPLCPYPQVARYKGAGSIDDAASFVCRPPDAELQ